MSMGKTLLPTTEGTLGLASRMATTIFSILTILCNIIILGPKFLLTVKMWINLRVNIM